MTPHLLVSCSILCRRRSERRRNPTGWGKTSSVIHTDQQWFAVCEAVCSCTFVKCATSVLNSHRNSCLMNTAFTVFWSSIPRLPPLHRLLILPAAPPQNLKMRYDYLKCVMCTIYIFVTHHCRILISVMILKQCLDIIVIASNQCFFRIFFVCMSTNCCATRKI